MKLWESPRSTLAATLGAVVMMIVTLLVLVGCSAVAPNPDRPATKITRVGTIAAKGFVAQYLYEHPQQAIDLVRELENFRELLGNEDALAKIDDIEHYLFEAATARLSLAPGVKESLREMMLVIRDDYRLSTNDSARQRAKRVVDWMEGLLSRLPLTSDSGG